MHLQRSYDQNNSLGGAGMDGLRHPVHTAHNAEILKTRAKKDGKETST